MDSRFFTMRVWVHGSAPGVDPALLILNNSNALTFFLEALSHGSEIFPAGETFTIVIYQGVSAIGFGRYQVHFVNVGNWDMRGDPEPVKLEVISETGDIAGVIELAWRAMIDECHKIDGINYEEK
jgi:hypothetical protein